VMGHGPSGGMDGIDGMNGMNGIELRDERERLDQRAAAAKAPAMSWSAPKPV
jgi:hypothetical protein